VSKEQLNKLHEVFADIKQGVSLFNLPFTVKASDRDYVDDWCQENGQYYHTCKKCGEQYIAHKRRHPRICNVCNTEIDYE